jgi:integrase
MARTKGRNGWTRKRTYPSGRVGWQAGYRDAADRQVTSSFATEREARDWLDDEKQRRAHPATSASAEARTLTLAAWIEDPRAYTTTKTRTTYQDRLRLWIIRRDAGHTIRDMPLARIEPSHVLAFLSAVHVESGSDATRHSIYRYLRTTFSQARRLGLIPTNPGADLGIAAPEGHDVDPLTVGEVQAMAATVADRYSALVLVLGFAGLRIGEASALRVGDIDWKRRTILVTRANKERSGGMMDLDEAPKTKAGRRHVPIDAVERELRAHVRRYVADPFDPDAHVFTGPDGGLIRPTGFLQRVIRPAATDLKLLRRMPNKSGKLVPTFRTHWLRHTAASVWFEAGLPIKAAQKLLGHASYTTTERIYVHLYGDAAVMYGPQIAAAVAATADDDTTNVRTIAGDGRNER